MSNEKGATGEAAGRVHCGSSYQRPSPQSRYVSPTPHLSILLGALHHSAAPHLPFHPPAPSRGVASGHKERVLSPADRGEEENLDPLLLQSARCDCAGCWVQQGTVALAGGSLFPPPFSSTWSPLEFPHQGLQLCLGLCRGPIDACGCRILEPTDELHYSRGVWPYLAQPMDLPLHVYDAEKLFWVLHKIAEYIDLFSPIGDKGLSGYSGKEVAPDIPTWLMFTRSLDV